MADKSKNGSAARKCESWINRFIDFTDNLHAPGIFRRWSAIATLASVLEQKVYIVTSSPLYVNLYVILTGHPGVGKTRSIRRAAEFLHKIPDFHFAPVSFTFASLVDSLCKAKRTIVRLPELPLEYNSISILADELGTFMHKYDEEMSKGLSALFYPVPYGHTRRGKDIDIKIKSPQVNMLCGVTPADLIGVMPESAWGQGLASRMILIFSDERPIGDDFASVSRELPQEMVHDLNIINSLVGEFKVTTEYRDIVYAWRQAGETLPNAPAPSHPKLIHYNSRRREYLYKLSMIAAIDRANTLLLTREDFNTAMGWLAEAETFMPDIFKAGASGGDSQAMDELYHYILMSGKDKGIFETAVVREAAKYVPAHSVQRVIENMIRGGMIEASQPDRRTGLRSFRAKVSLE